MPSRHEAWADHSLWEKVNSRGGESSFRMTNTQFWYDENVRLDTSIRSRFFPAAAF